MSEEKQIEEMADEQIGEMSAIIYTGGVLGKTSVDIAKILYAKCYRKQSEGEWVEHPHFNFEGGYSGANYECSNCHYDDCYEEEPYCPKCGAKMKGGAE